MASNTQQVEESRNFHCLISLMHGVGSVVLRRLLDDRVKAQTGSDSLERHLDWHKKEIEKLYKRRRILNQPQFEQLFPTNGDKADMEKFDVTLLLIVLINTCSLVQAKLDVLDTLRNLKNDVCSHPPSDSVSNSDFQRLWMEITKAVNDIASWSNDAVFIQRIKDDIRVIWEKVKDAEAIVDSILRKSDMMRVRCAKGYVYTRQYEKAKTKLMENGSVLVNGLPGEGKSTLAMMLLGETVGSGKYMKLNGPGEWTYYDPMKVAGVFIDDAFGAYKFDEGKLLAWQPVLDEIKKLVEAKNLKCILSSRSDVLAECEAKLNRFSFLKHRMYLSSKYLTAEEKLKILVSCLDNHGAEPMKEQEMEECVTSFESNIGFPYCCDLFASEPALFARGPMYFKRPHGLLVDNLGRIEKSKLATLILIFHNKGVIDETLVLSLVDTLSDINDKLGEREVVVTPDAISKCIEELCGAYLQNEDGTIFFTHNIIYEAIGLLYGKYDQAEVIRICNVDFFCQCLDTDPDRVAKETGTILVHKYNYDTLAKRITNDVCSANTEQIFANRMFQHEEFVNWFWDMLEACQQTDAFLGKERGYKRGAICLLSKSESLSFQVMLHKCIQHMECVHDWPIKAKCWKCEQKREAIYNACAFGEHWAVEILTESIVGQDGFFPEGFTKEYTLEAAFGRGNVEVIKKLTEAGLRMTRGCLMESVLSGNAKAVKQCISLLRHQGKWNPDQDDVVDALAIAYEMENRSIIHSFQENGSVINHKSVYNAVVNGKQSLVSAFVHELIQLNKWNPCQQYIVEALEVGYELENSNAIKLLEASDAISHRCVYNAVLSKNNTLATEFVDKLSLAQTWDPKHEYVLKAFELACGKKDLYLMSLLADAGVDGVDIFEIVQRTDFGISHEHLYVAVLLGNENSVQQCIRTLKRFQKWVPTHDLVVQAMTKALSKGYYYIARMLLEAAMSPDYNTTPNNSDDYAELMKLCVKHLKQNNLWDHNHFFHVKSLEDAFKRGTRSVVEFLMSEGVLQREHIILAVNCKNQGGDDWVKMCIKDLQRTNQWDPNHEFNIRALNEAFSTRQDDVAKTLITEGVTKPEHIVLAAQCEVYNSSNLVKMCINKLQETNQWDPNHSLNVQALRETFSGGRVGAARKLLSAGVRIKRESIILAEPYGEACVSAVKIYIDTLKGTNQWDPNHERSVQALDDAFHTGQYKAAEILMSEGVLIKRKHLVWTVQYGNYCSSSVLALFRDYDSSKFVKLCIENLKKTGQWDPKHEQSVQALDEAFIAGEVQVLQTLMSEGVLINPKHIILAVHYKGSFSRHLVKTCIENLKKSNQWDPYHGLYAQALKNAFAEGQCEAAETLISANVPIDPGHIILAVQCKGYFSRDLVKMCINKLKETNQWDPNHSLNVQALRETFSGGRVGAARELLSAGVRIQRERIISAEPYGEAWVSAVIIYIDTLKGTNQWDPNHELSVQALDDAFHTGQYKAAEILMSEGVLIKRKHLIWTVQYGDHYHSSVLALFRDYDSSKFVKLCIENLRKTGQWDPKHEQSVQALDEAFIAGEVQVLQTLMSEGVLINPKHIILAVHYKGSFSRHLVKTCIENLKKSNQWDPNHELYVQALREAFAEGQCEAAETLISENFPIDPGHNILAVQCKGYHSRDFVKMCINKLKETNQWDPNHSLNVQALRETFSGGRVGAARALLSAGVRIKRESIISAVPYGKVSAVKIYIDKLKGTNQWDPNHERSVQALDDAFHTGQYKAAEILMSEGVLIKRKHLIWTVQYGDHYHPSVLALFRDYDSSNFVKLCIENLKKTGQRDPKHEQSVQVLDEAFIAGEVKVLQTLISQGVLINPKHIILAVHNKCFRSRLLVKTCIENLKKSNQWDPNHELYVQALKNAFDEGKCEAAETLISENVPFDPGHIFLAVQCKGYHSRDLVKMCINKLKETNQWDPNHDINLQALREAFAEGQCQAAETLISENVPVDPGHIILAVQCKGYYSSDLVKMCINKLKETNQWDPNHELSFQALREAFADGQCKAADTLISENVPIDPGHIMLAVQCKGYYSSDLVKMCINKLKETNQWDPNHDFNFQALREAFADGQFKAAETLISENVPVDPGHIILAVQCKGYYSRELVKMCINKLKETNQWDPNHDLNFQALREAFADGQCKAAETLISENVPIDPGHIILAVQSKGYRSRDLVKMCINKLKETNQWDPNHELNFQALREAFAEGQCKAAETLISENVPIDPGHIILAVQCKGYHSRDLVKMCINKLKETNQWDPNHELSFQALREAFADGQCEAAETLISENVPVDPGHIILAVQCKGYYSRALVKMCINKLRETNQWDPNHALYFQALR